MRKSLILGLSLLTTSFVFSQDDYRPITLSVHFNPMVSWLSSDTRDIKFNAPKVGFSGGLETDFFFDKKYAINLGVSICSMGGKLQYMDGASFKIPEGEALVDDESIINYKLQYIMIPTGLKLKTQKIGYLTYFAHLGFFNQFRLKATASSNDDALQGDNIKEEISVYNGGYQFGLGGEYDLGGNTALIFGLSYYNGLSDITKNEKDQINLSNITLRIGVLF